MSCSIRDLKKWLAKLPPEFDDGEVCGAMGGIPSTCKRVIAFKYKDGSGCGIVTNHMGSHLFDDFWENCEEVCQLN